MDLASSDGSFLIHALLRLQMWLDKWDAQVQRRAFAQQAPDRHDPSQRIDTLTHIAQPHASIWIRALICLREIKTLPVITNLYQQCIPLSPQAEPDVRCTRVARDIGEAFLYDTEDRLLCAHR